jgi:surface protein
MKWNHSDPYPAEMWMKMRRKMMKETYMSIAIVAHLFMCSACDNVGDENGKTETENPSDGASDADEDSDDDSPATVENNPPSADMFVTRWIPAMNDYPDEEADRNVSLPLVRNGTYDFVVDWGDGTTDTIISWDAKEKYHEYSTFDFRDDILVEIRIQGLINGWSFGAVRNDSVYEIVEISQWGTLAFGDTTAQFSDCKNLTIVATDSPDISDTTSLRDAFMNCRNIVTIPSINQWDFSQITDLSGMFDGALNFNQDISGWDTSSVVNMSRLFHSAASFNSSLDGWDTSSVTDMSEMFKGTEQFNQDISSFDTSSVTDMSEMFKGTEQFNQDISSFDTSSVIDMSEMFESAKTFNQDIGGWDTAKVTTMYAMFWNSIAFDQNIGEWDIRSIEGGSPFGMGYMFAGVSLSTENYDALLIGFAGQDVQENVAFNAGSSRYSAGEAAEARAILVNEYNWEIEDGGEI